MAPGEGGMTPPGLAWHGRTGVGMFRVTVIDGVRMAGSSEGSRAPAAGRASLVLIFREIRG